MSKESTTATMTPSEAKIAKDVRAQIEMEARIRAEIEAEMKAKYAKKRKERTPSPEEVAVRNDIAEGNVLDVVFTNNLDPKADVQFTHGGVRFHFEDGKTYKDVPITVINFVNSKMYPNDSYIIDPVTKQVRGVRKGMLPRCGLRPTAAGMQNLMDIKKQNKQTKPGAKTAPDG